MATEEQTTYNTTQPIDVSLFLSIGQRLTVSTRRITKVGFWLSKSLVISGDVYFKVVKVSDDSVIQSKVWGAISDLPSPGSEAYKEVVFDSPDFINEEVRIIVEPTAGDDEARVLVACQDTDVKADEKYTRYRVYTSEYEEVDTYDCAYIYTYGEETPEVTTQACTNIALESLTGNGMVTDLGSSTVTQHGHCWSTSQNPTTDDDKTTKGAIYQTGHFASAITGLISGATYYFRAYATNSYGTAYGSQVSNTMGTAIGRRHIWIEGKDIHWFGESGTERKKQGVGVASDHSILPWL